MPSASIGQQILLQVILILLNAFFAMTEIAVISLNENKLKKQVESGDRKAEKMLKMVTEPTGFLSTIQIGITLAGFPRLSVRRRKLFRPSGQLAH